jgi:hypothetical protein
MWLSEHVYAALILFITSRKNAHLHIRNFPSHLLNKRRFRAVSVIDRPETKQLLAEVAACTAVHFVVLFRYYTGSTGHEITTSLHLIAFQYECCYKTQNYCIDAASVSKPLVR